MHVNNAVKWCYFFLVSSPTCHESLLHHSHIAWGWTTFQGSDETELKVGQLSSEAWLMTVHGEEEEACGIPHTHRTIQTCIFNLLSGNWLSWTASWWNLCHRRLRLRVCDPNRADRDQRSVYTQHKSMIWGRWPERRHYTKLKLKAAQKPNEICHFPVSAKWMYRRPPSTWNRQAAQLPSLTTCESLREKFIRSQIFPSVFMWMGVLMSFLTVFNIMITLCFMSIEDLSRIFNLDSSQTTNEWAEQKNYPEVDPLYCIC